MLERGFGSDGALEFTHSLSLADLMYERHRLYGDELPKITFFARGNIILC